MQKRFLQTISKRVKTLRLFSLLVCLGMLIPATGWGQLEPDASWGTDYNTSNEFEITDTGDLLQFATMVNSGKNFKDKTVKLTNDIVLNNRLLNADKELNDGTWHEWVPIGTIYDYGSVNGFEGTFDGQSHTVSGVYVSKEKCIIEETEKGIVSFGLFGVVDGGTVKNLGVTDSYIRGVYYTHTYNGLGGIAGTLAENAIISNCFFNGVILPATTAEYSYGPSGTGGIVGHSYGGTITACYNLGIVGDFGLQNIGGIVGFMDNNVKDQSISYSVNAGLVKGNSIGGICQSLNGATLTCCYNVGILESDYKYGSFTYSLTDYKEGEQELIKDSYALEGILDGDQSPTFAPHSPKLSITEIVTEMNKNLTSEQGWTGAASYENNIFTLPQLANFTGQSNTTFSYTELNEENVKIIDFINEELNFDETEYEISSNSSFGSQYLKANEVPVHPKDAGTAEEEQEVFYVRSKRSLSNIYELRIPNRPEYQGELKAKEITSTSITLEFETENKDLPYQYAIFDWDKTEYLWQDEPIFTGLEPSKSYDFQCGIKATDNNFANIDKSGNRDVTFSTKAEYTITLTQSIGGTISADKEKAAAGDVVTLSYQTESGYTFIGWIVRQAGVEENIPVDNGKFTMPKANVTVTAEFEEIIIPVSYYDLHITESVGAKLVSRYGKDRVAEGGSFTLSLEKEPGYEDCNPTVYIKRGRFANWKKLKFDEVSGYYQIRSVYTDIYVKVSGDGIWPVGNEQIETQEVKVYTTDGKLVVVTPQPMDVQVVSMAGALVAAGKVTGQYEFTDLAEGVYIVRTGDAIMKVRL